MAVWLRRVGAECVEVLERQKTKHPEKQNTKPEVGNCSGAALGSPSHCGQDSGTEALRLAFTW